MITNLLHTHDVSINPSWLLLTRYLAKENLYGLLEIGYVSTWLIQYVKTDHMDFRTLELSLLKTEQEV